MAYLNRRHYGEVLDRESILKNYIVNEDGSVYSLFKNRLLRPSINSCGYLTYHLHPYQGRIFGHHIVAIVYLPQKPGDDYEINHIDGNKLNNHYTNLEWVTHSDNCKKSYELGRVSPMKGVKRGEYSAEHRAKMSERKKKRVLIDGVEYRSIEDALVVLGIYRRKFNYHIKRGGIINGHKVEVLGVL